MEQAVAIKIFDALGAIGTVMTGIAAIFGIVKYFNNLQVKNELLYGDEAEERLKHIKEHFKEGSYTALPTLPYGGGDIKVPRLVISKISTGSKTISKDWKGKTALIKYYREAAPQELETYKAKRQDKETPTLSIDRWLV